MLIEKLLEDVEETLRYFYIFYVSGYFGGMFA